MKFKTETGSEYELDLDAMTWKRLSRTTASGNLRTSEGALLEKPVVEIGAPVALLGAPIREGAVARLVLTSNVVGIEA
jgi:hypothetical protein